jgi:hypothetical protein
MLHFKPAVTTAELEGILTLQAANLERNITTETLESQGFVTVNHNFELLQRMNNLEAHIIGKDAEQVCAYALAMVRAMRNDVPVLVPMFEMIEQQTYQGQPIKEMNYIVVGQVCVGEGYRGMGNFDALYAAYKTFLSPRYACCITEIATRNQRSIRAHQRVGFELLHRFVAPNGEEWDIVIWKW